MAEIYPASPEAERSLLVALLTLSGKSGRNRIQIGTCPSRIIVPDDIYRLYLAIKRIAENGGAPDAERAAAIESLAAEEEEPAARSEPPPRSAEPTVTETQVTRPEATPGGKPTPKKAGGRRAG